MRMSAAAQAIFCAGVMGGVVSRDAERPTDGGMLLVGGFLAVEIKTHRRWVCALLMLRGAAARLWRADAGAILRRFGAPPSAS